MSRGKYLSLEEARKTGRMDEFIKQNEIPADEQHPRARKRFEKLLDLAASGERKQKPGKHKVR